MRAELYLEGEMEVKNRNKMAYHLNMCVTVESRFLRMASTQKILLCPLF